MAGNGSKKGNTKPNSPEDKQNDGEAAVAAAPALAPDDRTPPQSPGLQVSPQATDSSEEASQSLNTVSTEAATESNLDEGARAEHPAEMQTSSQHGELPALLQDIGLAEGLSEPLQPSSDDDTPSNVLNEDISAEDPAETQIRTQRDEIPASLQDVDPAKGPSAPPSPSSDDPALPNILSDDARAGHLARMDQAVEAIVTEASIVAEEVLAYERDFTEGLAEYPDGHSGFIQDYARLLRNAMEFHDTVTALRARWLQQPLPSNEDDTITFRALRSLIPPSPPFHRHFSPAASLSSHYSQSSVTSDDDKHEEISERRDNAELRFFQIEDRLANLVGNDPSYESDYETASEGSDSDWRGRQMQHGSHPNNCFEPGDREWTPAPSRVLGANAAFLVDDGAAAAADLVQYVQTPLPGTQLSGWRQV